MVAFTTNAGKPRRVEYVALACLCVLGYNMFAWDDGGLPLLSSLRGRTLARRLRQRHWALDDAFLEAQRASARRNTARALARGTLEGGPDAELASDAEGGGGVGEEAGADVTCRDLGITPEVVAKSRIVGNTERWHRVIERVGEDPESLARVAVLGGSVPAGSECEGLKSDAFSGCEWPAQLGAMMRDLLHPNVQVDNLAHPATPSSVGITQVMDLVDYDVIIIQWTTNDDAVQKFYEGEAERIKPVFETLIRTALDLPKSPAVVLFEDLGIQGREPVAELMHYAIASIYEIPVISARAAFWRQHDFDVLNDWSNNPDKHIHPRALWHKKMACLVYDNWVQESKSKLDMSTWDDPLEQPSVFGGVTLRCQKHYAASVLDETLEGAAWKEEGWRYYDDVRHKWGYISEEKGSDLQFDIPHGEGMVNPTLFVHYVRSYTPEWGKADVYVYRGTKEKTRIDSQCGGGSQTDEIRIPLTPANKHYTVRIKNAGGKVKITGIYLYDCAESG